MVSFLPTFWMSCMCLGILALRARLPANATPVALIYLLGAVVNLRLLQSSFALNGWIMGLTFGIGGMAMSWVLYQAEKQRFNGQTNQE